MDGFDFVPGLDLELDFDLGDFDIGASFETGEKQARILRPRVDPDEFNHAVMFENALQFAAQIDLSPGARTFAWVNGNFIFGDILEALVMRGVRPKRVYICTLSLSEENVDSLKNVLLLCPDLERLVLIASGYFYSHYKFDLVPYMYGELDDGSNRVQIAFGGFHCKIIAIETTLGNTLIVHGSANLRSSNSIEQIMVEQSRELYEFNANIMESIAQRFGTINHNAEYRKMHRIEGKEAWEACKAWQADPLTPATEPSRSAAAKPRAGA